MTVNCAQGGHYRGIQLCVCVWDGGVGSRLFLVQFLFLKTNLGVLLLLLLLMLSPVAIQGVLPYRGHTAIACAWQGQRVGGREG